MNYVRNKSNVCFVCEMCEDNTGRITNMHYCIVLYIYIECGLGKKYDYRLLEMER